MMFSLAVYHESRCVVKWKIVDIEDVDDSYSFIKLFDQLKAGLVDGIDEATEWFCNRNCALVGLQVQGQQRPRILQHVH